MALKHTFNSGKSDGGDATLVQPSNWNAEHITDVGGLLTVSRTDDSDPATPSANNSLIYTKEIAGRGMLKWMGDDGVDYVAQPHFGNNNIRLVKAGTGTTAGISPTVVSCPQQSMGMTTSSGLVSTGGTFVLPAVATTNVMTQCRRVQLNTGSTSGAGCYIKGDNAEVFLGNAAQKGGFFFMARFCISTSVASSTRVYVGLRDVTTAPTSMDYTTSTTTGKIGIALTQNAGNNADWFIVHNVSASAVTTVDLGATNFATSATNLIEITFYAAPNSTTVFYRAGNLSGSAPVYSSGSFSSAIPAVNTLLSPLVHVNNATAATSVLEFNSLYLETDY
jgi:hypothetical protein